MDVMPWGPEDGGYYAPLTSRGPITDEERTQLHNRIRELKQELEVACKPISYWERFCNFLSRGVTPESKITFPKNKG